MNKQTYITEEEREKCKKVANAFLEIYQEDDVLVVDAGRFGFVKLQNYMPNEGFDSVTTYTDSSVFRYRDNEAQAIITAKEMPVCNAVWQSGLYCSGKT